MQFPCTNRPSAHLSSRSPVCPWCLWSLADVRGVPSAMHSVWGVHGAGWDGDRTLGAVGSHWTRPVRRPASRFQRDGLRPGLGAEHWAVARGMAGVCLVASVVSDSATPWTVVLPGSSVHGVSQARTLEWVAMPSSRGSSPFRDRTCVSRVTGGLFTADSPGKPWKDTEETETLMGKGAGADRGPVVLCGCASDAPLGAALTAVRRCSGPCSQETYGHREETEGPRQWVHCPYTHEFTR